MRKLLLILFPLIAIGIIAILYFTRDVVSTELLIGGERDQYGCLGGAGYTYDSAIEACVRSWEFSDLAILQAARVAVLDVGPSLGLSVDGVESLSCNGCFRVTVSKGESRSVLTLSDMQVVEREVLR